MSNPGDKFPTRDLPGKADNWGRQVEDRVETLEKALGINERSLNTVFRSISGQSVSIENTLETATDAKDVADNAQTSADGKNTIRYQDTPPEGDDHKVGDTWFDESDGNKIYTWDGEAWVEAVLGQGALADEISDKIDNAVDEARDAKDAAVQNANDILTLDSAVNQVADEARDAWNAAVIAMSQGDNLLVNGSFENAGQGWLPDPGVVYEENPLARTGEYVARITAPTTSRFVRQEYLPISTGGLSVYWEIWIYRVAGTGRININFQSAVDGGASGASTMQSIFVEDLTIGEWTKFSGTHTSAVPRDRFRVYAVATVIDPTTDVLLDDFRLIDVSEAIKAQDLAASAETAATEAVIAANGKTKIWRSTSGPSLTNNSTGQTGDVWWRYSNAQYTGPVIGQWTRKDNSLSGWEPTLIRSEVIESLTVDKLTVTGGATFPLAVIDTLVGGQAFIGSLYANRVIVDGQDFAPGPGGYEDVWSLTRASFVNNSNDPTGRAIRFNNGSGDGQVRGPRLPAREGQVFYIRARYSWYISSNVGGTTSLRMEWFDSPDGARINWSEAAIRQSGTGGAYIEGTVTAPAGTTYARFYVYMSGQTGDGDAAVYDFTVRPQNSSVLIENGAITGDKLAVNAITAGSAAIADAAITNAKIANLDAAKVTSGSFAGKTFTGGTFTGSVIRTAASGERIQLDSLGLRTFRADNLETARITSSSGGIQVGLPGGTESFNIDLAGRRSYGQASSGGTSGRRALTTVFANQGDAPGPLAQARFNSEILMNNFQVASLQVGTDEITSGQYRNNISSYIAPLLIYGTSTITVTAPEINLAAPVVTFQGDTEWSNVSIPGGSGQLRWRRKAGVIYLQFDFTYTTAVAAGAVRAPGFTLPLAARPPSNWPITVMGGGTYPATGYVEGSSGNSAIRNDSGGAVNRFIGSGQWLVDN